MRILLSLLFLIIISVIGNTQNTCTHDFDDPYQSLWKYCNTRNVFNEHFIKSSLDENGELLNDGIGEWLPNKLRYEYGGYNLPASHLYMTTNPSYIYDCYHGDTNPNVYNVLKWGDSPIKLGRYIATICTEYKLLELNGQYELRDQKIKELFLALQAYRRLDMTANRLWEEYLKFFDCTYHEGDISAGITEPWTGHNPDLSGYSGWFLREDVPSDFYNVM